MLFYPCPGINGIKGFAVMLKIVMNKRCFTESHGAKNENKKKGKQEQ
jgi:hypothetical protein